ncbi:MAG: Zn-ribbon domain-containing OB-fold protein [Armatimonadota bacterium]|nr:Zn-ribbon domain-containing OB-fold protein [Armatimonadota bacterium]
MPLEPVREVERLRAWRGELPAAHRYTVGPAGERFFRELKEGGRILGTRCGRCGITYVPGRLFCERCFDELSDWTEVGPAGTVEAVTALHLAADGTRLPQPVLLALIRLDGADTVLLHYLDEVPRDEARIGLRVHPALKPAAQRTGSILDITHFRPV